MTVAEKQKRNGRSKDLRVLKTPDGDYYVESSEGTRAYRIAKEDNAYRCSCMDYSMNIDKDKAFKCKHIMAIEEAEGAYHPMLHTSSATPSLRQEFIKSLQGKDFVLYSGLLDLAHQKGLIRLDVEVIQYPNVDNGSEAICRAVAETRNGDRFSDIGDASPRNTNKVIASHILRMASTRAKARCLRDMVNIGITCLEELGDVENEISDRYTESPTGKSGSRSRATKNTSERNSTPKHTNAETHKVITEKQNASHVGQNSNAKDTDENSKSKNGTEHAKMSEAQHRAILNLSKRRGISEEDMNDMVQTSYGVSLDELSTQDASQFIRSLQAAA